MLPCYNRGCGLSYDPADNKDDACRHHPGVPFFHDTYKGWSCCKKKSVDFTEFLNIKGCTVSKHSNTMKVERDSLNKDAPAKKEPPPEIPARKPIRNKATERPPYKEPMMNIKPIVAATLKQSIDTLEAESAASDKDGHRTGKCIEVNTCCENSGCSHFYRGPESDESECIYHPGVAIFHEGMKYWSCCQRKTSDFSVFLEQKGCVNGEHKWLKEKNTKSGVQCRYDWHQTPTKVAITVYAKLYHHEHSFVEVNPIRLRVSLVFPAVNNGKFDLDLELSEVIEPDKTIVHMHASKVEITLMKAENGSWAKLGTPRTETPASALIKGSNVKAAENWQESETNSDSEDSFDLNDVETSNPGIYFQDEK